MKSATCTKAHPPGTHTSEPINTLIAPHAQETIDLQETLQMGIDIFNRTGPGREGDPVL